MAVLLICKDNKHYLFYVVKWTADLQSYQDFLFTYKYVWGLYLHETIPDNVFFLSYLQSWRMFSEIHPLKEIASYHSQIKKGKFEETVYSILFQLNCKHFTFFLLLIQMLGWKIQASFQL